MSGMVEDALATRGGAVKWPLLSGAGVRVRPAAAGDADDWFAIRAQAGPWQQPLASVEAARDLLAVMESEPPFTPGWRQFMIERAGAVVGDLGLNWPETGHVAEIGFELAPAARGQGIARAAVGLMRGWLLGAGGLQAVVGITHRVNGPAQHVLEASGFVRCAEVPLLTRFAVSEDERLYLVSKAADA